MVWVPLSHPYHHRYLTVTITLWCRIIGVLRRLGSRR
jgi:hypothetical protein